MLDSVIASWLDSLSEREFDEPLRALLWGQRFADIHFVHGVSEFGRDFIAKRTEDGRPLQYALQSKAGDINLSAWQKIRNQIEDIRTGDFSHPAFDTSINRASVLVTTGRLVGDARLGAQTYKERYASEIRFELWDRDRLVELIAAAPGSALAGRDEGPLLRILGGIDSDEVGEAELERFSRRWIPEPTDPVATLNPATVIEASVIANRLRRVDRLDLSCVVALQLMRAAFGAAHGSAAAGPLDTIDAAKRLFVFYATELFNRIDELHLSPVPFINVHNEFGFFATYSVRSSRIIELLGLLGLSRRESEDEDETPIVEFLSRFMADQPGCAHPLSDRWAVSLIPAALVLGREHATVLDEWLRATTKWIGDRYAGDLPGLAGVDADPDEEISYLMAPLAMEPPRERRDSYLAAVVCDLCAVLELGDTYSLARNDFLAVKAHPEQLHVPDTSAQYLAGGEGIEHEINPPYEDEWQPEDDWKVAPHHKQPAASYWLPRIGRFWEHLALQSVLRDRHFPATMRELIIG